MSLIFCHDNEIITTQISLEEYLNAPSAENLLALGANRAQIIVESLERNSLTDSQDADTTITHRGMASAFKVAGLYTKVTACHIDGCGANVESAVEQTVGKLTTSHNRKSITVEPLTVDPPRKGHCMLDLSIKDIAQGPENYLPYSSNILRTSEKRTTSP